MRHVAQAGFLLTIVVIGWEFIRWVRGLEAGVIVGARPAGVEGFLPIAALLSLRHLFATGEIHPVRPAAFAFLVVGVFVGGVLLARATGTRHNAITDEEYAHRIRTMDSPAYAHDKGRVPSRAEWEAAEAASAAGAAPAPQSLTTR